MLWGGREGYETLLNTDIKRELDQLGRFLTMVVEHKHKIGFKGTILIEPKPKEPTKHQYDYDVATDLRHAQGLRPREARSRSTSSRTTPSSPATPSSTSWRSPRALGILGSIDINRGDYLLGWDTDQFAMNVPEMALACYYILKAGGFTTGGFNFDAKIRRQSIDPDDLLDAHVGSMDACARGLLIAEKIIEDGKLDGFVDERYAGLERQGRQGHPRRQALAGRPLRLRAEDASLDPQPKSGKQEYLEGCINDYLLTSAGSASRGRTTHEDDIKGPAIFLAQFAGDAPPFNTLDGIAKWAAGLGYKGVQIPTWDGRLFDLKKAARARPIATRSRASAREARRRDHRTVDPSAGPARRRPSGL